MAQTINVRITSRSRRGHSTITRNYTNLIRIQRTKSVKTNKTLPNILSLNARSILKKTDELAHVIYKHNSDVVMVSETWLSDDIPDEALHFPGIPGFSPGDSPDIAIVTAGDFNAPSNGFQEKIITNHCQLKQIVKQPTRGTSVLDLILSNIYSFYEKPRVLAPLGRSDHCIIDWKSKVQFTNKSKTRKIITRPIRDSSLQLFEELISRQSWSMVYNSSCINSKVDAFLNATSEMIDGVFPVKTFRVHEDDKLFISGRIKQMISKRDKLYQQGRMAECKLLRNKIVSEIRKEKHALYNEKIRPARVQDPKTWWKNVKKIVGKKQQGFVLMDPATDIPLNPKETANHMNNFFTNLTSDYPEVSNEWSYVGADASLPHITVDSVEKKLSCLKVNKAAGPFDPNTRIIKIFAKYFARPLTHIFNESFACRLFPDIWKVSKVCGIPKSKPCCSVDLLRPIALTSTLSKIQESYATEWIYEDVKDEISEFQFGGLPGTSAVQALIYLMHKWHLALHTPGRAIRIVFLDFRKAFDLVDHNKLLETLMNIGVRPALVGWFSSYLHGRSQFTSFQGEKSDVQKIKGGVPQGSKLGPLAFILKINNLPQITIPNEREWQCDASEDQDTVMFVDDTTLSEIINMTQHVSGSSIGNTQRNVNKVVDFAKEERMDLNGKKCKEMLIDFRRYKTEIPPITLNDNQISRVKSYKLLGLWLDDDLKWNTNTEYIIKKGAKRLYLLKILRSYGALEGDLLTFYCTVIRSVLEYGSQIWSGGLTQMQKRNIERIQKRALRIIYSEHGDDELLLAKSNLLSLEKRRNNLCASLIEDILEPSHRLHGLLPKKLEDVRERETRTNGKKIYNFFCNTERFRNSPLVHAINEYNFKLDK